MEDQIIESLSPECKEWFAKAVVGMIFIDGKVDDSEIEYLKETISFLKDKELTKSILSFMRALIEAVIILMIC